MKVIGHRGAAGLALENTTESIRAAINAGVDAIEFDVRVTKDGELVLSHDKHLGRVSGKPHHISRSSLQKLKEVPLHNGETVATLAEAMKAAGDTALVIEGKESGWARPLAKALSNYTHSADVSVISFNHRELYTFSQLMPIIKTYAIEHTKPFEVIRVAKVFGFAGIDINFWLLNPVTYVVARYHKLDIVVYTVNKPWIAQFIKVLYPHISITTDVPDQMQFVRKKPKLVKRKSD